MNRFHIFVFTVKFIEKIPAVIKYSLNSDNYFFTSGLIIIFILFSYRIIKFHKTL